jgi:GT2 family glycosyltransferase
MIDPTFSIIVPTFRRPDALRETLIALLALDYPARRYEVIVVDDGADAGTAGLLNRLGDHDINVRLESQRQRGAAAARNHGARVATGELLLFCDDDIVVRDDHLRRHCETRRGHGDSLVNGRWEFSPDTLAALLRTPFGRFRLELERRFQQEATGQPLDDGKLKVALVGSWNLALRRELFWNLGGFDEAFPVAGAEDQDLSLRARAAGCDLLLDPAIVCLHNDNRVDLRLYCAREERNARTMPILAQKYPREFGDAPYVRENRPISSGDPARLVAKKVLKRLLADRRVLTLLHRVTDLVETTGPPERVLHRLYTGLLGLHLFRGFRRTWKGNG